MAKKNEILPKGGAWIFRNIPRDLMRRAKMAAASEGTSIKGLVLETLEARIQEIKKKNQAHGKSRRSIVRVLSVNPPQLSAIER